MHQLIHIGLHVGAVHKGLFIVFVHLIWVQVFFSSQNTIRSMQHLSA